MYELVVGLNVKNDEVYSDYRKAMMPLLKEHQGGFRYDFKISETLRSETKEKINRVFTIYFGSEELQDKFFTHPEYLNIKEQFFKASVEATTIISSYHIKK